MIAIKHLQHRLPTATRTSLVSTVSRAFFSAVPKITPEDLGSKQYVSHLGRQQNHIWTREEIDKELANIGRHTPKTLMDKVVNKTMYGLYHVFNFLTRFEPKNTSVKAVEWRLIVLESIAGVPGFVAAGFRHFRSLRKLRRDNGWIATLLEEAENERMHLLVCMKMFQANRLTRFMVISAQFAMTPLLMSMYLIHPPALHRFVGYLEETACYTYANVIGQMDDPTTPLHKAWAHLPAPEVAINYWRLPADATFQDTLRCMFADETHHRDVNHTLADLSQEDPSPYALVLREDALRAFELEKAGLTAWPTKEQIKESKEEVKK